MQMCSQAGCRQAVKENRCTSLWRNGLQRVSFLKPAYSSYDARVLGLLVRSKAPMPPIFSRSDSACSPRITSTFTPLHIALSTARSTMSSIFCRVDPQDGHKFASAGYREPHALHSY